MIDMILFGQDCVHHRSLYRSGGEEVRPGEGDSGPQPDCRVHAGVHLRGQYARFQSPTRHYTSCVLNM